jgi:hypothetical protein
MEYTKGPWRKDGRRIMALKEKQVCAVPGDHIRMAKIDEGNAQLIAAAPAMYEALKEAVALLNHMYAEAMAYKPDKDKIEALAWNGLSGNSRLKQALALAEGKEG